MPRKPKSESSHELLRLLKVEGPLTTAELAEHLNISAPAVRQHTSKLMREGALKMVERRNTVGRPAQRWLLTRLGHSRFPDAHAEATVQLIASVRNVLGEAALSAVIADRQDADRQRYVRRMAGAGTLAERIDRLCELRNEEGYMAEVHSSPAGCLLVENHCPICAAAKVCQGFCANELALFQAALGPEAAVERVEHLITGDRRCAYRIAPAEQVKPA